MSDSELVSHNHRLRGKKIDFRALVSGLTYPSPPRSTVTSAVTVTLSSMHRPIMTTSSGTISTTTSNAMPNTPSFNSIGAFSSDVFNLQDEITRAEAENKQLQQQLDNRQLQERLAVLNRSNEQLKMKLLATNHQSPFANIPNTTTEEHALLPPRTAISNHCSVDARTSLNDLRNMEDVSRRVDQRMATLGFVSSDTTGSSGSSDSEQEGKHRRTRKGRKKNRNRRQGSGKLNTLSSDVMYPQAWPHSFLSMQYVTKPKKYDDLTVAEFAAGFCTILQNKNISLQEKSARLEHFRELMYLATHHPWASVKSFHAACLAEIERGALQWGQSFQPLLLNTLVTGLAGSTADSVSYPRSAPALFCSQFQRNQCTYQGDHYRNVNGRRRFVCHVCATCLTQDRVSLPHRESSPSCPHFANPPTSAGVSK